MGDPPDDWRVLPPSVDAPSPPGFAGHAKDWLWLGDSHWCRVDKIVEIDMGHAGDGSEEVETSYDSERRQKLTEKAVESRPPFRV